MMPLILRFAEPIPIASSELLRYDAERQITQILQGNEWVDAPNSQQGTGESTKYTKVSVETTDDA